MTTSEKLNLLKEHKAEYRATSRPVMVEVSEGSYLRVSGRGAPGSELFERRVEALYGMAYTLKFISKSGGRDYAVSKLEGLYGIDGQTVAELSDLDKAEWNWRLLIRVPDFLTTAQLEEARHTLRKKGKEGDFDAVCLDLVHEEACVQMLHVGPYDQEEETLAAMQGFAEAKGLAPYRWHHEIYLSDPRRIPPERLRTILRRPVRSVATEAERIASERVGVAGSV